MPYSGGTRLPGEVASKLGHLAVIGSEWVKSLVSAFDSAPQPQDADSAEIWEQFDPTKTQPLRNVWAVDGSYVAVKTEEKPPRELAFVKTALLTVDKTRLDKIDKDLPHPVLLQDIMADCAVFHATVFPLKNIQTPLGSNLQAVRHIVRDSMKIDQDGAFYETLKWIAYQKWGPALVRSPAFACPHCRDEIKEGLPADSDAGTCPNSKCKKEVFLTDMIGFHLDMDEESAPDSVSSAYMLIMETLMLFTAVRLLWGFSDSNLLSDTLFIKDGPLSLRAQYSKLVPPIRAFLQFAKTKGRPVHIIGQEKSGTFFDHLSAISRSAPPSARGERPAFAVLSHEYVRKEVLRTPDLSNPYGLKTNWGEKVLVKLEPGCSMVLNVPTGAYDSSEEFPSATDLIGLDRILATLPTIASHRFEGALFPIELANGISSMSSYPSARILQRFTEQQATPRSTT